MPLDTEFFIVIGLCFVLGTFSILASIFNWDFYFENRRARFFVRVFGRSGARIFYAILGLFIYFIGLKSVGVF